MCVLNAFFKYHFMWSLIDDDHAKNNKLSENWYMLACMIAITFFMLQIHYVRPDNTSIVEVYTYCTQIILLPCLGFQGFSKHIFTQVAAEEKPSLSCSLCGKHFSSQNAQQDHLRSKKHRENEKLGKTAVKMKNKKNEASTTVVCHCFNVHRTSISQKLLTCQHIYK